MALDTFNPYLFVSSGEQSNKFLTPTYADGIAQFQAQRAQALSKLLIQINPVQEGTGDPSPENIRPISGRTGLTVTVQSGDTQNTYPISWQTEAGTIYGGTLDVVSGVLTVDHILLSVPSWLKSTIPSGGPRFFSAYYKQTIKPAVANSIVADVICSCFITTDANKGYGGIVKDSITVDKEGMISCYPNSNGTIAALSEADFKTYMDSQQIIAALTEPQTYNITPTDVMTLAGFNQIYSDAGPVIDIKF